MKSEYIERIKTGAIAVWDGELYPLPMIDSARV